MKLHGLMVVQNEADVIEDILSFLRSLGIFDHIFFFDLGSEDETFQKAMQFQNILYRPQVLPEPYTEKLRYDLLLEHRSHYEVGDWVTILDADEFYLDDPLELIRIAETESATCIKTYQAQFMYTDLDLSNFSKDDVQRPIFDRRKFYLINWSEIRFYKFLGDPAIFDSSKPCSKRLLNRHYQYRSPKQIQTRISTRLKNKNQTRNVRGRQDWLQIYSEDWKDYVVNHKLYHHQTSTRLQFGIPEGIRIKDYYSKDPFSPLSPQIALHFDHGRSLPAGQSTPTESPAGEISFKDDFRCLVVRDMRQDFRNGYWKEAVSGLLVYLMYSTSKYFTAFQSLLHVRSAIVSNFFWNIANCMKRLLRGKSIGTLRAVPNPVSLSDYSGVGYTKLWWKSFRTNRVHLTVDSPEGEVLERGNSSGFKVTGEFVSDDMFFYLQDSSKDNAKGLDNTLARVRMKTLKGDKIVI